MAQDVEEDEAQQPVPSGHPQAGQANPQIFQPPPDTNDEDPRLPTGSIAITILNPDNAPLPDISVTLGILHNSVAKGESREHKLGTSDRNGALSFSGLATGSGIAYRISVVREGATFWASPFALPQDKGMRVQLHVYPVTHDIQKALIVSQVVLYTEMKDDRTQVEQAITFFNLGRTAWVPDDLVIGLPDGFTALNGQQGMGGEGIEPVERRGARVRGTFGPGQHTIDFRWQLPYEGEREISFEETLPPNVAVARALAAASQEMRLVVSGFPEAQARTDSNGERILVTERQMRREDPPLTKLHVELRDLPTAGPGRIIATVLAGFGVLAGVGYAFSSRKRASPPSDATELRARLLADLEELERAHSAGDIGPKTYERARRELIDAIARSLASPSKDRPETATTT
ncbi:MAG: hypothetical protein ACLQBL_14455 [Polyangiaceae bacterium]